MTTYLITGGAGFIGSNLVHRALAAGHHVVNLDALTYAGNLASLSDVEKHPRYRFVRGDIRDHSLVGDLIASEKPSVVVNMAAESHVDRSIDTPGTFIETNVVGTQVMLDCALEYWRGISEADRAAFRYIQVSTDEVYGSITEGLFSESSPYVPNSPYAASKAAADHLTRAYWVTYGLPAIVTNCSNNYGPYQFPEKLIPLMISKALRGEALPVYGDGKNVRDWIHVDDHCRAILAAAEDGSPGETYLIGAENEWTNIDLTRAICRALTEVKPRRHGDYEGLIEFVSDRPGHDRRYAIDPRKAMSELAWAPEVRFDAGLRETVRWYLENESWIEEIRNQRYRGDRLGLKAYA